MRLLIRRPGQGDSRFALKQFLFATLICASFAQLAECGVLDRIGVMGDSLSSEYVGGLDDFYVGEYYYSPYKSWVEQLVESRGVNFGPYGEWGWRRSFGYQYNMAHVYGAETIDVLFDGQHTELRNLAPTLAVFFVGANDFYHHAQDHNILDVIFGGAYDGQDPIVIVPTMLSRYRTAMETVAGTAGSPTGTQMVLTTVPDITRVPIAELLSGLFYPGAIEKYQDAITAFNTGIKSMAAERNFAVLDVAQLIEDMLGPPDAKLPGLTVGGNYLELLPSSLPTQPNQLFLHDGFHPNTITHGLIAQELVRVINAKYGAGIAPLTDAELLEMAGLEVVPEPSTMALFATALPAAFLGLRKRRRSRSAA